MKKKLYIVVMLIVSFIVIQFVNIESHKENDRSIANERVHYKLTNVDGISSVYNEIFSSEIEIYLNITPYTSDTKKVAYFIFMNGKQVVCKWNDEKTSIYRHEIVPNNDELIKITISDIPKGVNTFHIGTVYFPDKLDFDDEELLFEQETILNLKSFTVVNEKSKNVNDFVHREEYVNPTELLTTVNGDISKKYDEVLITTSNKYSESKKLYYHWINDTEAKKNVRFSLLLDWKQIEWPNTKEFFIDILVNPGEVITAELDLSNFQNNGEQLCVVAFLNPGVSFWFVDEEDKNNTIKADGDGALAFSTYRTSLKK
ncbi:MAG: hypothetical protein U9Q80_04215 [Bacillota bacterium]|nr:hypothetical protein [Bacillota bacterium]